MPALASDARIDPRAPSACAARALTPAAAAAAAATCCDSQLSLDELSGYAASWSAYATYRKQHPDLEDPILGFRRRLAAAAAEQGLDPTAGKLQLVTRCTLLLGLGPKHTSPVGGS